MKQLTIGARPNPFTLELDRTALIIIDMQNDFGADGGMFHRAGIDIAPIKQVVPNIARTLALARRVHLPILHLKMGYAPDLSDAGPPTGPNLLKHAPLHVGADIIAPDGRPSRILIRDTWNTQVVAELAPQPGELQMYKSRFSGFYNTLLDEVLRQQGIDTLIVTGCTTSVCVESTVRDAMFRDFTLPAARRLHGRTDWCRRTAQQPYGVVADHADAVCLDFRFNHA
jgi:ureidoacrylate peracid hydrolase